MSHTYYTSQRYTQLARSYAAEATMLQEEANQLTGKDREIAELSATAARHLARWHAMKSHTTRQPINEEGETSEN
jgi:hypothetical protein